MRSPGLQLHFDFFGLGAAASPSDEAGVLGLGLEVAGVLGDELALGWLLFVPERLPFAPDVVFSSAIG
jgi:hypothetical protein